MPDQKHLKPIFLIVAPLALLDQFSKYLILKYLDQTYTLIPNFFELELSQNQGIAFGLDLPQFAIIIFTLILLPAIIFFSAKEFNLKKPTAKTALALILGGALGNLIDRFTHGYVIDFIAIGTWPNFNLADIFITAGVLLLVIFYGKIKRV